MTSADRPSGRWFCDHYRDAVWESEDLTSDQKAVAETYARHARNAQGDKGADADLAWLTYPRLMAKAGVRRRAKVPELVASLVDAGWLVVAQEASRRSTLYRLAIPGGSEDGTTDGAGSSEGGTTEQPDATTDDQPGSSAPGTTVVPPVDLGSSTFVVGSSKGGTQPPVPPQEPLTPTPPEAEAAAAAPGDPHHLAAAELVHPYRNDMTIPHARDLTRLVGAALRRGWPADQVASVLADSHDHLRTLGPGLIGRVLKLGDPPAPHEIPDPSRRPRRPAISGGGYEPFRNLPDQAYLDWVAGGTPDHEQEPAA